MAITWDVKITPLNVERKEANIVAVRTDDIDPLNIKIETHTIITAILDTAAQKTAVLNQIWDMHLIEQNKLALIATYIGNLEIQAENNLITREG